MRDIRFRAFDKEKGIMIYEYEQSIGKIYNLPLGSSLRDCLFIIGLRDETLMQFAGVHDKNGREIYEGDIVYMNDGYEKAVVKFGKYTRVVDFYDHSNGQSIPKFSYQYSNIGFYLDKYYSFDARIESLPITYLELHSHQVVGTIYEHPNLLEST
jgi:uncharacterized phage protein (TIGR01671 family)